MKNIFFIIGLPRTRSTWLANFLTYKTGFCFHEAIRLCHNIKDMKQLLESVDEPNVGDADTMLIKYKDELLEMFPKAKWVIIKRDFEAVMASLENEFRFEESEVDCVLFKKIEEKILAFEKNHPALVINFEELNNVETCKRIWDYCIPDSPFNYKRWMQLDVIKMNPLKEKMLEFHGLSAKRTVKNYIHNKSKQVDIELLNKQLDCSLHGDFKQGFKIAEELEKQMLGTKAQLYFDTEEAFIKFKQLEEKTHNYIRADYNRGWYKMMHGDLLGGFTLMNTGRSVGLWGNKPIGTDKPLWDGSDLHGKHILFVCEAGFGDQMLFIRFVKDIANKGGKVIVACDDYGLGSVFSRMPEVSTVVNYKAALSVYHDCWIPSMAAPQVLKTTYDDLSGKPYLIAKDDYIKKFSKIIKSDKFKIGIRWLSMPREGVCNTLGDAYLSRKFPAQLMFDAVMGHDNAQLYSLQRDEGVEELPRESGIVDLGPMLQSWEDTAGAISQMDLVISSCTSIAHLAAAMGKPTWIIVPLMAYYTWAMPGEKTLWYDSVRLFRQEKYGKWDEPFEKIRKELNAYTA